MSISPQRQLEFAKYVESNKDVLLSIKERVEIKLFARFKTASNEERVIISDTMNADGLFYKEIAIILAENEKIDDE